MPGQSDKKLYKNNVHKGSEAEMTSFGTINNVAEHHVILSSHSRATTLILTLFKTSKTFCYDIASRTFV